MDNEQQKENLRMKRLGEKKKVRKGSYMKTIKGKQRQYANLKKGC